MPMHNFPTAVENAEDHAARLTAVLDTVIDGIITIDQRGVIQSFNPSAERIFGYTPDEVTGQNVKMLMPEPYHAEHDGYIRNYMETGEAQVIGQGREVRARRKNGDIFPMELGVSEMRIGGERMFVGTIRDISDRKIAEQALRDSEAKMQAILDNTVDGLITINDSGLIETFNKACQKIFGYTPEEVVGQNVKMLMPEPYHDEHDEYLSNHRRTGTRKIIGIGREVEGRRKDGSVFPIDLSVSAVEIQGRKIYSGILRDITERKSAEAEIMRSNVELERFAYIASHDLKEPLRMISNFSELLQAEYADQLDGAASEYMKLIMDASTRMQSLVSDLLEYARMDSEDTGFSEFPADQQLRSVLDNLHDAIAETDSLVEFGPLPVIYANPIRFSRLLQNLVANAIKYRAADRQPRIQISAEDTDTHWVFSIRDNGIGIRSDYLQQIFVIFRRLHGKSEYPGTGIGLAVCQKIVESFNGRIWAESTLGEGSTFLFTLPKNNPGPSHNTESNK